MAIERTDEGVVVELRGVDVYNPTTGEIRLGGTDYDGESFFVRHCYFLGEADPYARLKRSLRADIDEVAWAAPHSARSLPFPRPESGRIAIKVINNYGDEVLKTYDL